MTDPHRTAIAILVDRSGSMYAIQSAAEEAINGYVESTLKLPGDVTIRVSSFDADFSHGMRLKRHHGSIPAALVPTFILQPAGSTPLLDAIMAELTNFGRELKALPESARPGTVLFVIMTDGLENASLEYRGPAGFAIVKAAITRQIEEYGWNVVYLGANQDAISVGESIGVPSHSSITYNATDVGTHAVGESLNRYTASSVAFAAAPDTAERAAFTDDEREKSSR